MVSHLQIKLSEQPGRRSERGVLMTEMAVAMALLVLALFPLAFAFTQETRLLRAGYWRSVAMEIVDGEAEILLAGEWRAFPEGRQSYVVHAGVATNLPPGRFQLTRTGNHLRLEWQADERKYIGPIIREITIR